jgi:hypothetical protein
VASSASQRPLCHSLQTSSVLLVDGVCPNEDGLLGLDDLVAGLDALRSTGKKCQYELRFALCGQWWKNFVRLCGRFGPSLGLLELCLRHD